MKSYLIPFVLGFALALAACQPTPPEEAVPAAPSQAEDEAALKSLNDAYVSAANAADVPAVTDLFGEDALYMPPNEPTLVGREAIQSWLQRFIDSFTLKLTKEAVDVAVGGDWAFSRGTYTLSATPKAEGEAVEDSGRWIEIYRRQADGSWKIAYHIWSSDKPLPGATQE